MVRLRRTFPAKEGERAVRVSVALLILSVLFLIASPRAARLDAGGELVTNGGFETVAQNGSPAGWLTTANTITSVTSPPLVAEGSRAASVVTVAEGDVRVVQPVEVVPGGSYQLSGTFITGTGATARLSLRWFEGDGGTNAQTAGQASGTSAYQDVSGQVNVACDAGDALVEIVFVATSAHAAYFDAISLQLSGAPLPCPTDTPRPPPPPLPPGGTPVPRSTPRPGETPEEPAIGPLRNGGFEEAAGGRPVAWRTYGGALTQVSSPVRGGSFAGAFFSSSDSTKWVYQTVAVTPRAWYEFAAFVHMNDPDVAAAFLRVSWYTSADASGSAVDSVDSVTVLDDESTQYRRLSTGAVQAPPGVHSANVRVLLRPRSSAGAVIYIDDASFRPSTPDSAALPTDDGEGPSVTSRASGDGTFSEVGGVSLRPSGAVGTPLPTPVLERGSEASDTITSASRGGRPPLMAWAAAGGAVALVVGGWGAWRWRARTRLPL